jgi:hypothetical protein
MLRPTAIRVVCQRSPQREQDCVSLAFKRLSAPAAILVVVARATGTVVAPPSFQAGNRKR